MLQTEPPPHTFHTPPLWELIFLGKTSRLIREGEGFFLIDCFSYLTKHISIILIESHNNTTLLSRLRAFFIGYLGRSEHFRAITITHINNRANAEPIIALFCAFTLWPPSCILLWLSKVIQIFKRGRKKHKMTIRCLVITKTKGQICYMVDGMNVLKWHEAVPPIYWSHQWQIIALYEYVWDQWFGVQMKHPWFILNYLNVCLDCLKYIMSAITYYILISAHTVKEHVGFTEISDIHESSRDGLSFLELHREKRRVWGMSSELVVQDCKTDWSINLELVHT